jgi:hypothetical protein
MDLSRVTLTGDRGFRNHPAVDYRDIEAEGLFLRLSVLGE